MVKRLGVRTKNAAWAKETLQRATEVTNRAAQELSKFNPVLEQELRSVVIPVLNRLIG
jgi:AMMECR1 domain-containing protein